MMINEAVTALTATLPETDPATIRGLSRDDVVATLHGSLGLHIRNAFGLWEGNVGPLVACDTLGVDGAAAAILLAPWNYLNPDTPAVRDMLNGLVEPSGAWESPLLRDARRVCGATRREAGLLPVEDNADCRECPAADMCNLG